MKNEEIANLVRQKIENLRPKLLDLSRRNPLLSTKLSPRSNAHLRVVDELPEVLFYKLNNGQEMRFVALPEIDDDPKDENTKEFKDALANARLTDDVYLSDLEAIDKDADDFLDKERAVERALKDRVRSELSLPPRPQKAELNLVQHARNNGITPSYDLPEAQEGEQSEKHADNDIQVLLLPKDLERKLNNVTTKCRTWMQETGINVLHVAYGFLEWAEPNQTGTSFAPLVLCAAQIERKRTREGVEFYISGAGDEPEVNAVLAEKMRIDFNIEMPKFEGSIETYLASIAAIVPKGVTWRVRRQVAIGVFPSARMAMYHDIDPAHSALSNSDIVRSLLGGMNSDTALPFAEEYNVDEPEVEKKVPFTVLDADSSQFSALVDLANGKNLAVEGPPGTGKSQTIVNAIAAALADGKKVLFVAEKLAALNVVKSRLEAVKLGEFLLPLQAERSTREKVISSVRSRVEMTKPRPVRDYDAKIGEFRRIRSQLAEYIDLLTTVFDGSDLTVHEILGKNIATVSLLEGIPPGVLEKTEVAEEYISRAGLLKLQAISASAEQAFSAIADALPYWKGVELTNADRFTVEEICDLARRAGGVYRTISSIGAELENSSLNRDADGAFLEAVLLSLEGVTPLFEVMSDDALLSLLEPNRALDLKTFLERCSACLASENKLKGVFSAPLSKELLASVENIRRLITEFSFKTLDISTLKAEIEAREDGLGQAKDLAAVMSPFVKVCPEATKWNVVAVGKMQKLLAAAGREALLCRNAATSDPAALSILPQVCAEISSLKNVKTQLESSVSLSVKVELDELTRAIATLRSGNLFSNLFSDYRQAKRLAMGLVLMDRFEKVEALQRLELLASYRRREQELLQNPQAISLFGLRFRGVETDQKPFEALTAFYESVRRDLAGPDAKSMREFLRDADVDDLELVPAIPPSVPDATLETLQADLSIARVEIDKFAGAVNELQPLLSSFYDPSGFPPSDIEGLTTSLSFAIAERSELSQNDTMRGYLGDLFKGADTPNASLIRACEWALKSSSVAPDVSNILKLRKSKEAAESIRRMLDARSEAGVLLDNVCEKAGLDRERFVKDKARAEDLASFLDAAALDQSGLFNHASLASALLELRDTGTLPFVEYYMEKQETQKGLSQLLTALVMRKLAKRVFAKYGQKFSRYSGRKLDDLRAELARLDKELIELSRQQLAWKVYVHSNPPAGNGVGKKSSWTEMALIDNEIAKQQRFISVRDLTQRAGKALLELKPCWMMSPLAVAQYIPKGMLKFDLCIIDEASQMPPEAAIGALLRSKQIMVVGDTNQLPPSSFFKKMVDDEESDEDENVLDESILEMANATFRPSRRLRWHYRSRHSGLIKFSNRLVYDDNLVVFPSATEAVARMGVEFRSVEGIYKSGTNAIEARAIVDAALDFMRTDPNRSLGIVTLNQKQRDLIIEEFEQALNRDPRASAYVDAWKEKKDGLEEFFIKNLENVQGDERDVIFIGTVYGPEARGARVAQRFGPINGLAGKRRLNVLFSRAKEKIVTFSSMSSADILAEETGNAGVYMLKRWLEYCASGVLDGGVNTAREPDSDFEVFVMDQIRAMGYEPVPQVGVAGYFIDIGIRHPNWPYGYVLGVECDGASYHSAKSARDRDRLRQEVLEGLGWRFHRIWSTDWFNDPHQEAERLRGVLSARMEELKAREGEFTLKVANDDGKVRDKDLTAVERNEEASDLFSVSGSGIEKLNARGVALGDTVRVRYLDGDGKVMLLTISKAKSDLPNGVVHYEAPIAKALLGAEEGDEVEVLNGPYVRPAVIEEIKKNA